MRVPSLVLAVLLLAAVPRAVAATDARTIELDEGRPTAELQADGFTVRLGMEKRDFDGWETEAPVLRIRQGGGTALEVVGEPSGFAFPQGSASLLELDPGNAAPEVVFTSYTGGAHCCTAVTVVRQTADGSFEAIDVGSYDGDGARPDDVDGDGVYELIMVDNDFLYAFDCYACSAAPLVILAIEDGKIVDVSAEPRFRDRHRAWLKQIEKVQAEGGGTPSPGWWAGWVAAKSRVGEGAEAWRIFTSDFDTAADEGVSVCTVDAEECPDDAWKTVPFPQALEDFLRRQGYPMGNG